MVRAAAERFGVAELLDRDCAQLSDGQRQLVHLARLAVQDAPILLLDEPNSALDFENTGLLFRRVRELVETGKQARPDRPPRPRPWPCAGAAGCSCWTGDGWWMTSPQRGWERRPFSRSETTVPHHSGPPGRGRPVLCLPD